MTGGFNPTGTITFKLYNNDSTTGTPLFTDTETLSGGTATSKGYTTTATGTDYWVASYSGDSQEQRGHRRRHERVGDERSRPARRSALRPARRPTAWWARPC